jgi:3-oxoacyl-[acyl-carrier-protein] synthase-3
LLVGGDKMSSFIDFSNPALSMFGDGAGAVVIKASNTGITSSHVLSDGTKTALLQIKGGGSFAPASLETLKNSFHYMDMDGPRIFKIAAKVMASSSEQVLTNVGLKAKNLDLIIIHQANIRIIESYAKIMQIPMEKIPTTIKTTGNTSSGSLPIVLSTFCEKNDMSTYKNILFTGVGGGLNWGACLYQL